MKNLKTSPFQPFNVDYFLNNRVYHDLIGDAMKEGSSASLQIKVKKVAEAMFANENPFCLADISCLTRTLHNVSYACKYDKIIRASLKLHQLFNKEMRNLLSRQTKLRLEEWKKLFLYWIPHRKNEIKKIFDCILNKIQPVAFSHSLYFFNEIYNRLKHEIKFISQKIEANHGTIRWLKREKHQAYLATVIDALAKKSAPSKIKKHFPEIRLKEPITFQKIHFFKWQTRKTKVQIDTFYSSRIWDIESNQHILMKDLEEKREEAFQKLKEALIKLEYTVDLQAIRLDMQHVKVPIASFVLPPAPAINLISVFQKLWEFCQEEMPELLMDDGTQVNKKQLIKIFLNYINYFSYEYTPLHKRQLLLLSHIAYAFDKKVPTPKLAQELRTFFMHYGISLFHCMDRQVQALLKAYAQYVEEDQLKRNEILNDLEFDLEKSLLRVLVFFRREIVEKGLALCDMNHHRASTERHITKKMDELFGLHYDQFLYLAEHAEDAVEEYFMDFIKEYFHQEYTPINICRYLDKGIVEGKWPAFLPFQKIHEFLKSQLNFSDEEIFDETEMRFKPYILSGTLAKYGIFRIA